MIGMSSPNDFSKYWGYPHEEHFAKTMDGYHIGLYRIPAGRYSKNVATYRTPYQRPTVVIWHGLAISCDAFLCQTTRDKNLAFYLADEGFDVWLANTRGNKYSKGHDHEDKSPHSSRKCERLGFWDFTIDHLAKFDVPAVVDYILSVTGRDNLAYIGYSQGTSQIFAAMSLSEELNQKVIVVLAMAPALRPKPIDNKYINGAIRLMKPRILFPLFGIIEGSLYLLLGWECAKFGPKEKREPLFYHLFSDAAVSNVVHWFQIIENEEFAHYDKSNHKFFPSLPTEFTPTTPALKYPTRHIKTGLHLYCGERDSISDLRYLRSHLPEHTQFHMIDDYEHMDFLWAECAKEKLYVKIVDQLKKEFAV